MEKLKDLVKKYFQLKKDEEQTKFICKKTTQILKNMIQ